MVRSYLNVCSAGIRARLLNVVRRCAVGHFASVHVAARQRQRITSSAASVYSERVLVGPLNNASRFRNVVVVLLRAHDSNGRVQVRSSVRQVRSRFVCRRVVNALNGLSASLVNDNLSRFVRTRRRSNNAVTRRVAYVERRGLFALLRKSKVRSAFALATLRSNGGRVPLQKICRRERLNGLEFYHCRVRRIRRFHLNVRRSIIRVRIRRNHAVYRLLANGASNFLVAFLVGRSRRLPAADRIATFTCIGRTTNVCQRAGKVVRLRRIRAERPRVLELLRCLVQFLSLDASNVVNSRFEANSATTTSSVSSTLISRLNCLKDRQLYHLIVLSRLIERSNVEVNAGVVEYGLYRVLSRELRLENARNAIRACQRGEVEERQDRRDVRNLATRHSTDRVARHGASRGERFCPVLLRRNSNDVGRDLTIRHVRSNLSRSSVDAAFSRAVRLFTSVNRGFVVHGLSNNEDASIQARKAYFVNESRVSNGRT